MFPFKDNIPTDRVPVVTIALIAINVFVFLFVQKAHLSFGGADVDQNTVIRLGAIPCEFTGRCAVELPAGTNPPATPFTAISSMFLHAGVLHIAGNMLFLWIFGNNVEDVMGRARFVAFYLLGGLAAIALQIVADPASNVPTIGASGAVAGVLGGYILMFPRAKVLTFIPILFFFGLIELPALVVLGLWFAQQVLFGLAKFGDPAGSSGGVAYFAHIGGFVFGLLAIRAFTVRTKRTPVY